MAEYLDNAAGITTTTGQSTSGLVISNSIDQYGPIIGAATNGATYPYYIKYVDVADGTDYETGQGTWDSGSATLTSISISTSSNAGNAVNWGPGQKAVFITADSSLSTDMENMVNGATKLYLTTTQAANIAASKTKTDLITVTQAVNLDQMEADIAAFASGMTYKGNWDASTGVFPGSGTAQIGDFYYVNVSGTVDSVSFTAGDNIVALTNNASISTFAGNWSKHDQTDAVQSVAGLVGTITSTQLRTATGIVDPFSYKVSADTPIFMIVTGQSNLDDIEEAVTDFPLNNNVWDYAWQTPYSGSQGGDPAVGYAWEHPDPSLAFTTAASFIVPDIGYRRGGRGSAGYACANALQQATGRDVYVLKICWSGTPISVWESGGLCKQLLDDFVPYVLANTAALADVDWPDIVIWGQSEGNALPTYAPADYLTPLEYKDAWLGVYNYADGVWWDNSLTRVYCIEATQYCNWSGVAGGGALADVPFRWEGINAVERWAGDRVTMVSSVGIPWNTVAGAGAGSAAYIHYTGDGCNAYGERIADIILGRAQAKGLASSQLFRERYPVLGGDMDADTYDITDIGNVTAATGTVTTLGSTTANLTTANITTANTKKVTIDPDNATQTSYALTGGPLILGASTQTYNYASAQIPPAVYSYNTHIFQQSAALLKAGQIYMVNDTYKNLSSVAANLAGVYSFDSAPTYTADSQSITNFAHVDFNAGPSFGVTGGGALALTYLLPFQSSGSIGSSVTLTTRVGYYVAALSAMTGAVTNQVGVATNFTAAHATNNTHILIGALAPTAGSYGIYQDNAANFVNRWSGGHRFAYRTSNATSITMTVADHVLKVTTTSGPATVNLPTAVGNTGLHFIIKRTGTQNVTVDGNASETLDGTATKVLGTADHVLEIVSDGANWLCVKGPGAP